MIRIVAHLRRQIESYGEAGGALREQVAVAPVAFLGGAEAGVLPHGPKAAAIHFAVDPAGVWEFTRLTQVRLSQVRLSQVRLTRLRFARRVHDREIRLARRNEEIP